MRFLTPQKLSLSKQLCLGQWGDTKQNYNVPVELPILTSYVIFPVLVNCNLSIQVITSQYVHDVSVHWNGQPQWL